MGLILSIETATAVCSVALHDEGQLLALQELHLQKSHSGYLAVLIKDIVKYTGYTLNDLDIIALSKGPGSYTGLRIGTATAKGLCYALDIPLVAINTLEAMAFEVNQYSREEAFLCPMIDARRMEVYCLIADWKGKIIKDTQSVVVDENAFAEYLKERQVLFFGDGAAKCQPLLDDFPNAKFIHKVTPSAKNIGALAFQKVKSETIKYEDIAYFEPFYLKEFKTKQPKSQKI